MTINPPSAPAVIASNRRAERRFDAEASPITGFGALLPTDSLVERIETIWGLAPRDEEPYDPIEEAALHVAEMRMKDGDR